MIDTGSVIGGYRLLEEVGMGGMGKVYRGLDTMLNREVAIKVLRPEMTQYPSLVERFRNEAVVLAKLNHPHIALLYNLLQYEQQLLMVMEFLHGETLDHLVKRQGVPPYNQTLKLFIQILETIAYAHQHGVVHRDIKPSNIMISPEGMVKVMDFGIARVLGTERMTREGSLIGTLEYMAPEQIRGHDSNERTDIYALGILLYELLTGKLPFSSPNQFDLMRAHIETPPPPLRASAPHIAPAIEQAVLRALAKMPEDRFASAWEFRNALLQGFHPESVTQGVQGRRQTLVQDLAHDDEYARLAAQSQQEAESIAAETRRRLVEEARHQSAQEAARFAAEERNRLIEEARKQAEQEAARFAADERRRLIEEARKQAEQEAARQAEAERQRLLDEARKQAEHEANERAAAERQRLIEESRRRAEEEAAQRAASERLRMVEVARRQAEQQAANLAAAERQRLVEEARKQAEAEAARVAAEEEARLIEEARKKAEQEAARLAAEERPKLLAAAQRRAEQEASQRAATERQRLIEEARHHAELEASQRAAAVHQQLLDEARHQAEEEAARIAIEEEQRLFEEARKKAEEEAAQVASAERARLIEEARRRAEFEAGQRASKERQRLVEEARKQAEEEAAKLEEAERARLYEEARKRSEEEAAHLAAEDREQILGEARKRAEKEAARRAAKERKRLIAEERKRAKREARQSAELIAHTDPYGTMDLSEAPERRTGAPFGTTHLPPSRTRLVLIASGVLLAVIAVGAFLALRPDNKSTTTTPTPTPKPAVDMVRIPGGKFMLGSNDAGQPGVDQAWALLQMPAHEVPVAPFAIDRTEVTNAEYAQFVRATNHPTPDGWQGQMPPAGQEQWPVSNVSIADAQAFAAWRSRRHGVVYRLPTEAEWEFAAKGQTNQRYPWGDQWSEGRANLGTGAPKPVGSYPQGASGFGVLDMIGNVDEWTASPLLPYPGSPLQLRPGSVVRGGNYSDQPQGRKPISVTSRGAVRPGYKDATIGFRLVRDAF